MYISGQPGGNVLLRERKNICRLQRPRTGTGTGSRARHDVLATRACASASRWCIPPCPSPPGRCRSALGGVEGRRGASATTSRRNGKEKNKKKKKTGPDSIPRRFRPLPLARQLYVSAPAHARTSQGPLRRVVNLSFSFSPSTVRLLAVPLVPSLPPPLCVTTTTTSHSSRYRFFTLRKSSPIETTAFGFPK
jgi:hypothetical protein